MLWWCDVTCRVTKNTLPIFWKTEAKSWRRRYALIRAFFSINFLQNQRTTDMWTSAYCTFIPMYHFVNQRLRQTILCRRNGNLVCACISRTGIMYGSVTQNRFCCSHFSGIITTTLQHFIVLVPKKENLLSLPFLFFVFHLLCIPCCASWCYCTVVSF